MGVERFRQYRFLREATQIEARLGTGFGLEYDLNGWFKRDAITVTFVHPPIPDNAGRLSTGYTARQDVADNTVTYWFDEERELVAGDWTFRLSYKGKPLCERTFKVLKP